ncbi:cell surface glycoprotein CD200 receptor 1 [Eublepharis macularius]|uniref:Cell surface glycoprotein CD200 receptor 1 n=1 Tax=Eublepharis macularius TaxID=481883 RepID=A0AA97J3M1_EUBMA|nr:cell surface glycoprotein CD200 receptor 1 [Eublepharis macularius]
MISDIHFVMKTWVARILLTITVIVVPVGSFPERGPVQNNSVQHLVNNSASTVMVTRTATQLAEEKSNKSAVIGTSVTLVYPWQWQRTLLTVWNVKFKNGTKCHLSYMSSKNVSHTNCSEKNINWLSRPDQEYALLIKPLKIFNEGTYKCSSSIDTGTFSHEYALTVLVPPQVILTYDHDGTAVCMAAAGKPAAQITWGLKGYSSTVKKTLPNGTETTISTYNITSSQEYNVTCYISHPAWNKSCVLSLQSGQNGEKLKGSKVPILYSVLAVLLGIVLIFLLTYLGRLLYGNRQREVETSKSPERNPRHSIQENEMEPYATFVQMENVIYETTFDASVEKQLPPGLSPSP